MYEFEDLREFLVRRPWLVGDTDRDLVTADEYRRIKDRTLTLGPERAAYLRAFAAGWKRARE